MRNPRQATGSRTPAGRLSLGGVDLSQRLQGKPTAVNGPLDRDREPNAQLTHHDTRDQWTFNRPHSDGVHPTPSQWDDLGPGHTYMGPNDVLLPAPPIVNPSSTEASRAVENNDPGAGDEDRFFSTGTRSPANGMAMVSPFRGAVRRRCIADSDPQAR